MQHPHLHLLRTKSTPEQNGFRRFREIVTANVIWVFRWLFPCEHEGDFRLRALDGGDELNGCDPRLSIYALDWEYIEQS